MGSSARVEKDWVRGASIGDIIFRDEYREVGNRTQLRTGTAGTDSSEWIMGLSKDLQWLHILEMAQMLTAVLVLALLSCRQHKGRVNAA